MGGATRARPHHPFPKRAVVDLWPDRVRVEITQIHDGDGAGREIKERFDRDGDGVIDDAEYGALETFLVDRATRTLSITLDGQKVALSVRDEIHHRA
ncbi:MAG: hypothetical protein HC882_04140 [Acidobacteria bacterium]|nr:hypothetical protein [Acidobacteriota bacterium]